MTDTDFGDLGIDDFGRNQLIIGLYSAIKALLWLLEAACVSPAVFPNSWHSRPQFDCPKSLKNTDFERQNHKNCLQTKNLQQRYMYSSLMEAPGPVPLPLTAWILKD